MDKPKLLIKYQEQYLCEYEHYEYRLIHVPTYFETEPFSNISIFIMLLLTGVIDEDYFGLVPLNYEEALERSEMSFFPDYLRQIDENTFYYDVDALINDETKSYVKEYIEKSLEKRPKRIILNTLKGINETKKRNRKTN